MNSEKQVFGIACAPRFRVLLFVHPPRTRTISGSSVLLSNQTDLFWMTVGVRQGCLLPLFLFSLFLEDNVLETTVLSLSVKYTGKPIFATISC